MNEMQFSEDDNGLISVRLVPANPYEASVRASVDPMELLITLMDASPKFVDALAEVVRETIVRAIDR